MPTSLFTPEIEKSTTIEEQRALQLALENLSMLGISDDPENSQMYEEPRKTNRNMTECVAVPSSEHVAEIVGRQGCKIKALRAKTNTYIKTPVRGEEPVFVVTGRKEDVEAAKREILAAAEHFSQIRAQRRNNHMPQPNQPGQTTIQVRVPYRVVGLVVGPKGATIKRIQQQTHTYIVTPSRDKEPIFEVTGMPENVEIAREEIQGHIAMRTGGLIDPNDENDFQFNGKTTDFLHSLHGGPGGNSAGVSNGGGGGGGPASTNVTSPPATAADINEIALYKNGFHSSNNLLTQRIDPADSFFFGNAAQFNFTNGNGPNSTAHMNGVNGYHHHQHEIYSGGNGFATPNGYPSGGYSGGSNGGSSSGYTPPHSGNLVNAFFNGHSELSVNAAPFDPNVTAAPIIPTNIWSTATVNNNNINNNNNTINNNNNAVAAGNHHQRSGSVNSTPLLSPTLSDPSSDRQTSQRLTAGDLLSSSMSAIPTMFPPTCMAGLAFSTSSPSTSSGSVLTESTASGSSPQATSPKLVGKNCLVCYDKEVVAALVPCGHNLFCMECANIMVKKEDPQCPVCFQPVTQAIRIFS